MAKKKKSGKKAIIWTVVAVVVVALLAVAFVSRRGKSSYSDETAKTGDITTYYSFSGTIAAVNSQMVYAKGAVQISEIDVKQGQKVKKDDVLMKTATGTEITAPIDGTVSELDAAVDAQQMPGAQLCKIVDYSNLELDVQVDEYDLPAISDGKTATVTVNALGKDVSGKVTEVSEEGMSQGGVTYFDAKVSLPDESDLRVGMTAQAKILNKSVKNVTTLPMSAIQFDSSNNPYVYMSDGKRVLKKVSLTLGVNDGTNVEVKSGLKVGDVVKVPPAAATAAGFGGMRQAAGQGNNTNNSSTSGVNSGSFASGGGNGK